MTDDVNAVDFAAVAELRTALRRGTGVAPALRRLALRYPVFLGLLFYVSASRRFGPRPDIRQVTAFTSRIKAKRAEAGEAFPARQAEVLLRFALGELALLSAIEPADLDDTGTQVTILCSLFEEWHPLPAEIDDLLDQVETATEQVRAGTLSLPPALERWLDDLLDEDPARASGDSGHPDSRVERIGDLDQAVARDPGNVRLLCYRGLVRNADDRPRDGLADFNAALAVDPADSGALTGRAAAYRLLGRHDEALADYERVLAADPRDHNAISGRATALMDADRYEEALAGFTAAIELGQGDESEVADLTGRGLTYLLMERYDDAVTDLNLALAIDPRAWMALTFRADAHRDMGRYEQALADYDAVIEACPDDVHAITGRGLTYRALGRADEAAADFDRADEDQP